MIEHGTHCAAQIAEPMQCRRRRVQMLVGGGVPAGVVICIVFSLGSYRRVQGDPFGWHRQTDHDVGSRLGRRTMAFVGTVTEWLRFWAMLNCPAWGRPTAGR